MTTDWDEAAATILARNTYNTEFAGRVSFFRATERPRSFTCDRVDFIGRDRTLARPSGLLREQLSGRFGAGLDPCAALQLALELEPGATRRVAFVLGQGRNAEHAQTLAAHYKVLAHVETARASAEQAWDDLVGTLSNQYARRLVRSRGEPVAALPDSRVPRVGALRTISAGRRLRVSAISCRMSSR